MDVNRKNTREAPHIEVRLGGAQVCHAALGGLEFGVASLWSERVAHTRQLSGWLRK